MTALLILLEPFDPSAFWGSEAWPLVSSSTAVFIVIGMHTLSHILTWFLSNFCKCIKFCVIYERATTRECRGRIGRKSELERQNWMFQERLDLWLFRTLSTPTFPRLWHIMNPLTTSEPKRQWKIVAASRLKFLLFLPKTKPLCFFQCQKNSPLEILSSHSGPNVLALHEAVMQLQRADEEA